MRGNTFNQSNSHTWQDKGLFELPLNPEHYLPYAGNADVGLDNVTFDWQARGGLSLSSQAIWGFAAEDIFIGRLGLFPSSINLTDFNQPIPSVIGSLTQQNSIPSTSWGYLAGASYYTYPYNAYGSLTFGGYDLTRLDNRTNLTLAGGSDPYRPFLLGVESITSGSDALLSTPIIAALDSFTSQIWLPISVCRAFESAFSLVWNDTYSLYLLDATQHSALLNRNPSITFTLSAGEATSTARFNITLPYAAFDLQTSAYSTANESSYYFPLKQAANESQYVLGRAFMQEVYMLADYDRGRVTLFPGLYPESSVEENIMAICHPNATVCNGVAVTPDQGGERLSTSAIVGIAIGGSIILIVLVLGIMWFMRRKARAAAAKAQAEQAKRNKEYDKPELDGIRLHRDNAFDRKEAGELDGLMDSRPRPELDSGTYYSNSRGSYSQRLSSKSGLSQAGGSPRFEMPDHEAIWELERSRRRYDQYEMQG